MQAKPDFISVKVLTFIFIKCVFFILDRRYNIYNRRKASNDHGEKIMKIDR